jgi:hypothetical protein
VGSLYKEFSKNFYLYQNFCIWAYANYDYWYIALVYTVCRFAGAFVVVYFQHRSDSILYNLSHVQGTAEYVPIPGLALFHLLSLLLLLTQ